MDRKTLTIVLAVALIASFFLGFMGPASGLDIVQTKLFKGERFILLLIPISGVLLLVGAMNNGNYPLGRGLLTWLSLLAILYWILGMPLVHGGDIGKSINLYIKHGGIGFWMATVASLVLAFYNPRS